MPLIRAIIRYDIISGPPKIVSAGPLKHRSPLPRPKRVSPRRSSADLPASRRFLDIRRWCRSGRSVGRSASCYYDRGGTTRRVGGGSR